MDALADGGEDGLGELVGRCVARLGKVHSRADWEAAKAEFFGPNGSFTAAAGRMGSLSRELRPEFGKKLNGTRARLESLLGESLQRIESAERESKLGKSVDPTLPVSRGSGLRHPLSLVRDRMVEIFHGMGFSVASGSEVETEWACFDALNVAETHPARDSMDTFFLPDEVAVADVEKRSGERYLLRAHMTTVQIRSLLAEKLPLRVIAPGRVFRRDSVDATHSANFHQCDVVHVDRHVSVADLKDTIDFFFKKLFGEAVEMRYRPSFFPFTEPSFEVDMRTPNFGKLSNVWIEILGCGMIHPSVFHAVNLDPDIWSGQAWGIGIERVAMLLFGVDDVRHFYRNDLRFLRQFNG